MRSPYFWPSASSASEGKAQVGRVVEVLVAEGEGRKDELTLRMSGRAADNRLVHFAAAPSRSGDIAAVPPRPGDMASVAITYAAPHHLVADVVHSVRRTKAGDAWESRQASRAPARVGVLLGMPVLPSAR